MFIMTTDCYNQNQEKSTMTFIYWNLQNLNNVIINKTKVLLSQAKLSYLAFQFFDFEHIWWRLFWAYLMKVILSIPDEGYFERTWWRLFWVNLMKVIPETHRLHYIWYTTYGFFYFKETRTVFTFILYPFDLTGI